MNKTPIHALIAALVLVQGCSTTGNATRTTLLPETPAKPAASRAIEGSLLAPLEGGLISQATVPDLRDKDRISALQAEYRALEHSANGETVAWAATSGSISGKVVSGQPYRVGTQDCRQYTHTIVKAGQSQEIKGAACRNGDGSWSRLT